MMAGPSQRQAPAVKEEANNNALTPFEKLNLHSDADRSGGHAKHSASRSLNDSDAARDAALQKELASVRQVNEAIEGVIRNLERAKTNMATVNQSVGAASTLLNTWSRILSQTEHNQRVILSPSFEGLSKDMADMESESQAKQQAAQRREVEEQERKAAAAKRAEEAEQRRMVEATKPPSTSTRGRGRGRVTSRVPSAAKTPSSAYGASDSSTVSSTGRGGSYSTRRPASGIGRVSRGTTRGRG